MDFEKHFVSIDRIKSPGINELYTIWKSKCSGDRFPNSKEINPDTLPENMRRYLLFLEIHQYPLKAFYLYVGKAIIEYEGVDITNKWLHELDDYAPWDKLDELNGYLDMIYRNGPTFAIEEPFWIQDSEETTEWGIFPLSDDGEMITHAVSFTEYSNIEEKEVNVRYDYTKI